MKDKKMEPGFCPRCECDVLDMMRVEKDVNILIWYECRGCGGTFIECYSLDSKGLVPYGYEEE